MRKRKGAEYRPELHDAARRGTDRRGEENQKPVAAYLDRIVRENGYRLNTGVLSTAELLNVLCDSGYPETAYLSLYGTNVLGLNVAWIGIALMVSKVFDGISDVIVGFLIDRTHTRFGKARPYALAIVPYWICIALLLSAPKPGEVGGIIYLFVMYTLANTVCSTLYACAEAPHMQPESGGFLHKCPQSGESEGHCDRVSRINRAIP